MQWSDELHRQKHLVHNWWRARSLDQLGPSYRNHLIVFNIESAVKGHRRRGFEDDGQKKKKKNSGDQRVARKTAALTYRNIWIDQGRANIRWWKMIFTIDSNTCACDLRPRASSLLFRHTSIAVLVDNTGFTNGECSRKWQLTKGSLEAWRDAIKGKSGSCSSRLDGDVFDPWRSLN